jgi:hypothetical protein
MSEPIGMSISIGGTLPANLLDEFLSAVKDEISDVNEGPLTIEDLKAEAGNGSITWQGTSNYGLCQDLTKFCREHNLSYNQSSDAKDEYDATMEYWVPGMKDPVSLETNAEGRLRVDATKVRPLMDLLLSLLKNRDSLATFIGVEGLESIVEKGLKKPSTLHAILKKHIDKLLPVPPSIPAFNIKE